MDRINVGNYMWQGRSRSCQIVIALIEAQGLLPSECTVLAYLGDVYIICPHSDTRRCDDIVVEFLHRRCHIDVKLIKHQSTNNHVPFFTILA